MQIHGTVGLSPMQIDGNRDDSQVGEQEGCDHITPQR